MIALNSFEPAREDCPRNVMPEGLHCVSGDIGYDSFNKHRLSLYPGVSYPRMTPTITTQGPRLMQER